MYLIKDNVNCDFTLYNTLTFYCSNLCFSIQTNKIHSRNTVTKETLNFISSLLYPKLLNKQLVLNISFGIANVLTDGIM